MAAGLAGPLVAHDDRVAVAGMVRKRAASIRWAEVRSSLLETADTYDALAQTIEDIAERQAQADLSDRRTPEAARPFAEPVQQAVE